MGSIKRVAYRFWSIVIHSAVLTLSVALVLTYVAPNVLFDEPKAFARQVGKCMNHVIKNCCDLVTLPCIYTCSPDPCCAQITYNAPRIHVYSVGSGNPPSDYTSYTNTVGCFYKEATGCGTPCPLEEDETPAGCTDYYYNMSWETCP